MPVQKHDIAFINEITDLTSLLDSNHEEYDPNVLESILGFYYENLFMILFSLFYQIRSFLAKIPPHMKFPHASFIMMKFLSLKNFKFTNID